jgi:hypothetical protein
MGGMGVGARLLSLLAALGLVAAAVAATGAHRGSASVLLFSGQQGNDSLRPTPGNLIVGKAVTLPRALFEAGRPGSSSLIRVVQAHDVATAMWNTWETALVGSNTRALSQLISPGRMLAGTVNNCAYPGGRCVYETEPRRIDDLKTIVPLQQSYPIYFLAEIRTTNHVTTPSGSVDVEPWMEIQILTKASSASAWRLSFDTGFNGVNGAAPPTLPFDLAPAGPTTPRGGRELYNPAPRRAAAVPANRFLALLAAYWQSYKDTGRAPARSAFVPNGYMSGVGERLAQQRQGSLYAGHRENFSFTADPRAGSWEFSLAGYPMVCGSVVDHSTNTALGGFLNQNPDESNYGIPLPP